MGRIVLLASYPKSGNTWVRAFLTSIWRAGGEVDINRLMIQNISSRAFLDPLLGVPSSELSQREIAALRAQICSLAAAAAPAATRLFLKIHDALPPQASECPEPILQDCIDRVLYIVRDPRDVAPSFARHLGKPVSDAIACMADPGFTLSIYPGRIGQHVGQLLSTWSAHVSSWLALSGIPVHVLRYEALLAEPECSFRAMLRFLQIEADDLTLARALAATRLAVLHQQEATRGFAEKTLGSHRFFHAGLTGGVEGLFV